MIEFKLLDKPKEWEWFTARNDIVHCTDTQGLIAHVDGAIQAMCVVDSFSMDGCHIHFVVEDGADVYPAFPETVANYVYRVLGRTRAFGYIGQNNEKCLLTGAFMGFTEVARIPNAINAGVDQIVMCLERKDCRWLPQELREEAA